MTLKSSVIIGAIIAILFTIPISNVSASGIRHDSGDDATAEESHCWIDGYDSGFAGKYDSDRALECIEHSDNYDDMWAFGCEDAFRTEAECGDLMNNPVEIEDFEALEAENDRICHDAGVDDGKAGEPVNEDRRNGCSEFDGIGGGYRGGYQFGCETHTTQASCELVISGEETYCPNHPDIVACVEFLQNATNKRTESPIGACAGMGDPGPGISCPQESNPEKYCLMYDNPTFCRTIGDLCDPDGFVKPEYPYCTTETD
ncbi:MAG: hypothetical protein ACRD5J_02700 [Nitrososphaeraceae archaeon]